MSAVESRTATLHGHEVGYLVAGSGPVVVLVHGIAGSSRVWEAVMQRLAERCTVIAPDLLGHGASAKPRGDYSLGAYASGVRDLLGLLGHDRVTVVGHSFGGGIAMQFAYQFPEWTDRLVLVSSGGLGTEVSPLLRAASLPGAEVVLPLVTAPPLRAAADALGRAAGRVGLRVGDDVAESLRSWSSLAEGTARSAFLSTLRGVVDVRGQRVNAMDRIYLAGGIPTLLVWGSRDRIVPASHGRAACERIPGARLEVFEGAGHFPHLAEPVRFADLVADFVRSTKPRRGGAVGRRAFRELLRGGAGPTSSRTEPGSAAGER